MATKLTIHRALTEIKTIDSRIAKAISEIQPVGIRQKGKLVYGHTEEAKFVENAKKSYQSVQDLIARKNAIKAAIVLSNSKTIVTVANKEMSVADAITAKGNAALTASFIDNLKNRSRQGKSSLEKQNAQIAEKREIFINASLGGDKSKAKPEEITSLSKMFDENNGYEYVDPLNIDDKIAILETELQDFLGEVDAVLSESNAITSIEV
ncbi:MAG: hypothetical protein WC979_02265 [Candidatus Pacearchaeota archaeon]|nr:hypothetical protein [Clostridia bacterium]